MAGCQRFLVCGWRLCSETEITNSSSIYSFIGLFLVSKKPNSPKIHIAIDGQHIKQVTSCMHMYIRSLITEGVEDPT